MKRSILILIIYFSINTLPCLAQRQGNIWYFGDSSGVDFNGATPIPLLNGILGCDDNGSVVSDSYGNLLFYAGPKNLWSPNITIFNKQHQVMMSGDSILGEDEITQGTLILPYPNDSSHYFVLTLFSSNNVNYFQFGYSIVNMNLDSGLGGVEQKNIQLSADYLTEMMAAVRHANGRDWWVIVHKYTSNEYIEYLIDPNGISGPYSQNLGTNFNIYDCWGGMTFSPDGTNLCLASSGNHLELSDFDRCSGLLSNVRSIDTVSGLVSCSFSPSGKVLYVSNFQELYQYNLTVANITNSRQTIFSIDSSNYVISQQKLANNNKIYVGTAYKWNPNSVYDTINMNLSVINSPDSLGAACNFAPYSFNLGGRRTYGDFPNIPNYSLGVLSSLVVDSAKAGNDTIICQNQSVIIGSPAKAGCIYSWSPSVGLDDSAKAQPIASPTQTTTYILSLTDTNNTDCKFIATTTDTIVVRVVPFAKANAGTDTTICKGNSAIIGTILINGYAYNWQPYIGLSDSTNPQPFAKPNQTTIYTLTMTDTTNSMCRNSVATSNVVVTVNDCYVNKIYPNPAIGGILNIEYKLDFEGTLTVYDILGQKVFSIPLKGLEGMQELNISTVSNGFYYWRISSTKESYTGKITVMN